MTFLQPLILAALPLIALPILIHLINQRRFQTVPWAAMMFLLAANRMSRGYAKLRQWLILATRVLAIAGLIFAVSRPLASGWLGLTAGGQADTTIILLDRSPSMQQQGPGTVASKLESGRQQLARTLAMLRSARWVLIENTLNAPREIESPEALLKLTVTEPASSSADIPAMLETARDYIQKNKSGRTEIWICSDIRQNDWNSESGRWKALRDSFLELSQGVRFHLLAYSEDAPQNVAVRVTQVRKQQTNDSSDLLLSLKLTREPTADGKVTLPVQFEIEGARSELTIEMNGPTFELKDHRIPIERSRQRGWGKVSIPADANRADNDFYFVFDNPPPRKTIIVSDDPNVERPLQLAASISPDPNLHGATETVSPDQLSSVEWETVALLLWRAALPEANAAAAVQAFVKRGGQVIFFPTNDSRNSEFLGTSWQNWVEEGNGLQVETWRGDQDLLAHTQSGAALPVGSLQIRKYCGLRGEWTSLASLRGGVPWLVRVPTSEGGVYFCATTPAASDSSLAADGVVLYVLVQRALSAGAEVLGNTRELVAGEVVGEKPTEWHQIAGPTDVLSTEYPFQSGVYGSADRLLAVNRSPAEDQAPVVNESRVAELFHGLDFTRVNDRAGSFAALVEEIWRLFLLLMMVALLAEAALCLPKRPIVESLHPFAGNTHETQHKPANPWAASVSSTPVQTARDESTRETGAPA